jgi:hypothetical protein
VWQPWERYQYILYVGTALLAVLAWQRPNTNPRDWALDEGEERLRRKAAGLPVEFGVNYAGLRYLKEHGALTATEAEELEAGAVVPGYMPPVPESKRIPGSGGPAAQLQ